MGLRKFDRKFGADFLKSVPASPGVYRLFDEAGTLIYVGKAKNLRRRLAQYRLARRKKRTRKMRTLVADAVSIAWEVCESELDAELREIRLIQSERPKNNIAGAFSFLYPMIGMKCQPKELRFVFTTSPEHFSSYTLYGAYRSRFLTAEAFFALMRLLRFLGHPVPHRELTERRKFSYVFGFRRLPGGLDVLFDDFLRGVSLAAVEELSMGLLNHAGARAKASDVQEDLAAAHRFFVEEAQALQTAIRATGYATYPVPQAERDPLFLRFRSVTSFRGE